MASVRFVLNKKGLGELALRGPGIGDALRAQAERMAARARAFTDEEITVVEGGGRVRRRVSLVRSAQGEAADRALGRSVGGA